MYIPNYPEDSVLRRHYEAAAEIRRQARLSAPPTDSVLLRHYQQREQLRKIVPTPVAARRPEPAPVTHRPPASAPKAEPVTAQQPTARSAQGGGLLDRLKRFFSS
jgi:hypothetical protein